MARYTDATPSVALDDLTLDAAPDAANFSDDDSVGFHYDRPFYRRRQWLKCALFTLFSNIMRFEDQRRAREGGQGETVARGTLHGQSLHFRVVDTKGVREAPLAVGHSRKSNVSVAREQSTHELSGGPERAAVPLALARDRRGKRARKSDTREGQKVSSPFPSSTAVSLVPSPSFDLRTAILTIIYRHASHWLSALSSLCLSFQIPILSMRWASSPSSLQIVICLAAFLAPFSPPLDAFVVPVLIC